LKKDRLKPLLPTAYDIAIWKKPSCTEDCYVVLEGSYYSAPFRLVGQKAVDLCGQSPGKVIYEKYELSPTPRKAQKPE